MIDTTVILVFLGLQLAGIGFTMYCVVRVGSNGPKVIPPPPRKQYTPTPTPTYVYTETVLPAKTKKRRRRKKKGSV